MQVYVTFNHVFLLANNKVLIFIAYAACMLYDVQFSAPSLLVGQ